MTQLFQFGEDHPNFPVRVLNEREARGAAGIMFLFALIAFMTAWFQGDFSPTKLVIVAFFIDFFIRVIINPRYAPTLIMARWMVNNQTAEYVGAPQKRFAWGIGLALATLMMYAVVLNDVRGPINMITCLICLLLLFLRQHLVFVSAVSCSIFLTKKRRNSAQVMYVKLKTVNPYSCSHGIKLDSGFLRCIAACLVTHVGLYNVT